MSWTKKQHPIEHLVEWLAPVPLAVAVCWAAPAIGFPVAIMVPAGLAAFAAGLTAMKFSGVRRKNAGPSFDLLLVCEAGPVAELPELLLEERDVVLELDDPLVDVADDSRVVRLFAKSEPTPGELVERIADFLGDGRPSSPSQSPIEQAPADASAALHAALANIRASLR